ncbi:MAG: Imm30 family immunity protein [Crocosphaera sp.]|nr:Imm30 family immunity protein [Crocosphaera sp.]
MIDLLKTLKENRLMKNPEEVIIFEETLEKIAEEPDDEYLKDLHLILDDNCEKADVMFGLVHFLESFDLQKQIEAFIAVIPQLIITAPEWTKIIHYRIVNDELACGIYQKNLELANKKTPHFLYQLLNESVKNYINSKQILVIS